MACRVRIIISEFHQQYPAALGKEVQVRRSFPLESVDDAPFKTFQSDRMELKYLRNMIGCEKRIGIPQSDEGAMLGTMDQFQFSFEHDRAGTLCSDERSRDIEPFLRQQFIQVVAGYPTRNLREARADQAGIVIADCTQLGINLPAAATPGNDLSQFGFACGAHGHLGAVI